MLCDVVNADFKRVVTCKIFPVHTRIFFISRGSPRATNNDHKFLIFLEVTSSKRPPYAKFLSSFPIRVVSGRWKHTACSLN